MVDKWLPSTWRAKEAKHIPIYENKKELEEVLSLSDRIVVMFNGNIVGEKINKYFRLV